MDTNVRYSPMSQATVRRAMSADGTRLATWCSGLGDPILFVHGMSESHVNWQPVAERLSSAFTVCTMDRRGRGKSGDGAPYAFAREAEDVAAVAATLGQVVVLAHSVAGPFALEAAMASDAVRAVILYEAWSSPPTEMPTETLEEIEHLVSLGRYDEVFTYGNAPEEIERSRRLPDYADRLAAVPTFPREIRGWQGYWQQHPIHDERWRALDKPVLMLIGELNRDYVEPAALRFAEHLPQATIRILDGQGHFAYQEAPDLVAAVLRPWLDGLDR